tara:strand:- start:437 stop:832 length:396 start_codon:yes stop_codon:yes gene_type:complete
MIIKNCFYKKPELQKSVQQYRKEVDYLKASGHGEMIGYDEKYGELYTWEYNMKTRWSNTEYCIRELVDHCIVSYALDHSDDGGIDTKDCVMDRDDMRKLILFNRISTQYDIRGLKYVDDMIDLVAFILKSN